MPSLFCGQQWQSLNEARKKFKFRAMTTCQLRSRHMSRGTHWTFAIWWDRCHHSPGTTPTARTWATRTRMRAAGPRGLRRAVQDAVRARGLRHAPATQTGRSQTRGHLATGRRSSWSTRAHESHGAGFWPVIPGPGSSREAIRPQCKTWNAN